MTLLITRGERRPGASTWSSGGGVDDRGRCTIVRCRCWATSLLLPDPEWAACPVEQTTLGGELDRGAGEFRGLIGAEHGRP